MSPDKIIKGPFEVHIKTPDKEWSKMYTDATSASIATSTAVEINMPDRKAELTDVITSVDNLFDKQPIEESNHLSFGLELGHPQYGYVKVFFKKEKSSKK